MAVKVELTNEQVNILNARTQMIHPEGAPSVRDTGDCAVRAIALALDCSYQWTIDELTDFQHNDATDGVYHEFVGWYLWDSYGYVTYEFHDGGYYFDEFLLDGFFDGLYDGLEDIDRGRVIRSENIVFSLADDNNHGHATCMRDGMILDSKALWLENWRIYRVSIDPRASGELRRRIKERGVDHHRKRYSNRNKLVWVKKYLQAIVDEAAAE